MANEFTSGDFILVSGKGFLSSVIKFGERLRDGKRASKFSHAALIVDSNGTLLEATSKGIVVSSLASHSNYTIVNSQLSVSDRCQSIVFAESMKGIRYGFLDILSIAVNLLTPGFIDFSTPKSSICSEFVVRCLEHGGYIIPNNKPSNLVMPSDLAMWFKC